MAASTVAASIVVGFICFAAPPAAAHDLLVAATPAPGSTVRAPLHQVEIEFSGAIDMSASKFQVTTSSGRTATTGRASSRGQVVTIPVDFEAAGTGVVTWVVVGTDAHPVRGQYVFTITGPGGTVAPGTSLTGSKVFSESSAGSTSYGWLIRGGRFVEVALLYLILGILLIRVLVLRNWSEPAPGAGPRTYLVLVAAGAASAALMPVLFLLYAGRLSNVSGSPITSIANSSIGWVWLAKLVLWGLFGWLALRFMVRHPAPGDAHDLALLGVAAVATAAFVSNTHALGISPEPLWVTVMWAHIMLTALWSGGLAALVLLLLPSVRPEQRMAAIQRYSRLMTVLIAAVVLSGLPLLSSMLGGWHRMWCTSFGVTAGFKIAVVLGALGLGAVNNRLVHFAGKPGDRTSRTLVVTTYRLMALEAVVLVAVLGLSALLGETALPPRIRGGLLPGDAQDRVSSGLIATGCKS